MTNPNNAIGTSAAYGGRTSVNARNDDLAALSGAGVVSGFEISPDSGMDLYVGGSGTVRDVAVVEDAAGNRTTVNNISGSPISVTIPGAPSAGSRIDTIVVYVANPPQGSSDEVDNPAACGLIVASGTAATTPQAPSDSDIRSAITADGASGATAYFARLGQVRVPAGTTDLDATLISAGTPSAANIADGSITSDKVDFTTLAFGNYSTDEQDTGFTWINGKKIFKKTIVQTITGSRDIPHGINNLDDIVEWRGAVRTASTNLALPAVALSSGATFGIWAINQTVIQCQASLSDSVTWKITLFYTKTT